MEPIADSEIKRVLVINAHPDDSDFGASGTIAQWVKQGIEVSYVLCTNGDQGGEESGFTKEEMPKFVNENNAQHVPHSESVMSHFSIM